uniref:Ig-like domain-containing protein n=1 Tax=Amphimedon queenslandica TaxID=400682 RepID=A0A1X7VDA2_AMPQE
QFKENNTLVPKTFTWGQPQVLDCTGYVPGNFHSGYKVTWLLDGRQQCIKNSACEDNSFNINPDNFSLSFDYYPTFTTYECQIEPDMPGSSMNVTVASYTLSTSKNDSTQTTFIKNLKPVLVENGTNKVEFSCSASVQSNASINFEVSDLFGNEPISPADCDVTTVNPTIRSCSKTLHGMNVRIICDYSTSYEIHCTFSWNLTNSNESRVYPVACHVNDGTTEASTRTELIVGDSSSVGSVSSSLESASFSLESSVIDSSSLDSSVTNPPSTETPQLLSSTLTIVAPVVLVLVLCVCIIIVFVIVIIVRRNRKKKLVDLDLRCVDNLSPLDDSRISLDLNSACQSFCDNLELFSSELKMSCFFLELFHSGASPYLLVYITMPLLPTSAMKTWLLVSLLLLLVLVPNAIAFSNPTRNGDDVTLPPCNFPNGIYYQNGPNPGTPVAPVNQNYTLTINGSTEGRYTCGPSGSGGQITLL